MAASALELRPRSAVGLMDAALRLCARTSSVWAITLPGLTALTAALFHLIQELQRNADPGFAGLWLGAAWLFRAFCQGAACHQLQATLLEPTSPTIWASYKAALRRAPSLLFVSTWLTLLQWGLFVCTLGFSFLFTGPAAVLWSAAMQRRGPLWKLPFEAGAMLGPSRGKAAVMRGLFSVQLLVGLNLHGGFLMLLYLLRKLLGIDLAWLDRFAALDNPSWVALLVVVTFGLFEPLRAATATLLLLDARVRKEGMDLTARLAQLPPRVGRGLGRMAALLPIAILAALLLGPAPVHAQAGAAPEAPPVPIGVRLEEIALACDDDALVTPELIGGVEALGELERPALLRWVASVERMLDDDEDCEPILDELERGLNLTLMPPALPGAPGARSQARAILAGEEFAPPLPDRPAAEAPAEVEASGPSLWQRWVDWWKAFLEKYFKEEEEKPREEKPVRMPVGGGEVANLLLVVLAVAAVVVLVALILQGRRRPPRPEHPAGAGGAGPVSQSLDAPVESALARPPDAWVAMGDALAAQGRYREAVRSVYLALLAGLHARGDIRYDPHVSNWEQLRGFRGPREHLRAFRELTRRFDFAWYGLDAISSVAWEDFRNLAVPLLAPDAPEARRA